MTDSRVAYVDRVLGFMFENTTFAVRFAELGEARGDLVVWYRNAEVYDAVTRGRKPREAERIRLATMIESIRLDAMAFYPPLPGETIEFDLSCYEFSEDVLSYKEEVVSMVLRQERESPSPEIAP